MSDSEEFSKYTTVQNCPVCGGEIVKGYVTAIRGVLWDDRKIKRRFVWSWSSALVMPFYSQNVPALRCKNCSLVIFRYEKKQIPVPEAYFKKCVKCGKNIPIASEECPYCGVRQKGVKP
jgi:DNA-directed RNA polymerase subunit RPC12/RpoP